MTHKDYEQIAAIIREMNGEDFEGLRPVIARRFANDLRLTNPKFDRFTFLKACGILGDAS